MNSGIVGGRSWEIVFSGASSLGKVFSKLHRDSYIYEDEWDRFDERYEDYNHLGEDGDDLSFGSVVNAQSVRSGGYASGAVFSGCRQVVCGGASADGTTLFKNASMYVYGTGNGVTVNASACLNVDFGGSASGVSVLFGGTAWVGAGTLFNVSVFSHGNVNAVVRDGGSAFVTGTNAAGGSMRLSGNMASGFILFAGGWQGVCSGGTTVGITVSSGGRIDAGDGGTVLGASVFSGGVLAVAGGSASGTKLLAGAKQVVSSGIAENTDAASGAKLIVDHGGSARTAAVAKGGLLRLGGSLSGLDLAGKLKVSSGGRAEDVRISGGKLFVLSGGLTQGASVCRKGSQVVSAGGTASETTLSGGMQIVEGRASGAKLLAGASQLASGSKSLASGTVLSGARQTLDGGARAVQTSVKDGWQYVRKDCTASRTSVLEDGQQIVYAEGSAVKTTVSSGGLLKSMDGAFASSVTLKAGAEMDAASGNILGGANSFTGALVRGGTSSRPVRLAKGASLAVGAKTDMSRLHLKAAGAVLSFSGAGNRLGSLALDSASKVSFDVSRLKSKGDTLMLSLSAKNAQKTGAFSVSAGMAQGAGVYELSQNLVLARDTPFTVYLGAEKLGTAKLNGAGFSRNGVTYSMTAAKDKISLSVSMKGGKTLKGTAKAETLSGGADSDVFFGSGGNDAIKGSGGRDCAVYGKENWGQDTVAKTSGTLALVFRDLKAADVVQKLSGSVMTVSKKADPKQKITVSGWNASTHGIVFGGTMKAFDAWAKASKPTAAQTSVARAEVWKKAGLAA